MGFQVYCLLPFNYQEKAIRHEQRKNNAANRNQNATNNPQTPPSPAPPTPSSPPSHLPLTSELKVLGKDVTNNNSLQRSKSEMRSWSLL